VGTGIVDGRARREIIQVLRTYICAHTITPTLEQYKAVCKVLIKKFPTLQDTAEGKSKYVRWILQMQFIYLNASTSIGIVEANAFKNFQKKIQKENRRKALPALKKLKFCNDEESNMDEEEYAIAVEDSKKEYTMITQKKGGSYAELKRLVESGLRIVSQCYQKSLKNFLSSGLPVGYKEVACFAHA